MIIYVLFCLLLHYVHNSLAKVRYFLLLCNIFIFLCKYIHLFLAPTANILYLCSRLLKPIYLTAVLRLLMMSRLTHNLILYILILLSVLPAVVAAQNATSSPSSRYGYGELIPATPISYRAMGGVSAAMRRSSSINLAQPASYTGRDSLTFMFDIAGSFLYTAYNDAVGKANKLNGNLEYVNLSFPLYKRYIAFAAGISPYSAVGYNFAVSDSVASHKYNVKYNGEGGITQLTAGLSVNLFDWVSFGANFYYMFGDVTNITELSFSESDISGTYMYRLMHVSSIRGRYGAQLHHTFARRHNITLGAVYEPRQRLRGEYVQYELTTLDSVRLQSSGFQTPEFINAGISYAFDDRLIVAFDYTRENWSKALYFGEQNQLSDRSIYAVGFEYRHNPFSRNYAERMLWRAGFSLGSSYSPLAYQTDWSAAVGLAFPLRTSATLINLTLEYNRRQPYASLVENSLKLTVGVGVNENWFFKRKL